jgi:hypothetical protein
MALYHISYKNYNIGDTITRGSWGNAIKSLNTNHFRAWMDLYLEETRLKIDPALVSRLNCLFAFNDSGHAEGFAMARKNSKIYELNIDPATPFNIHNFKIISYFGGFLRHLPPPLLLENKALLDLYWVGTAGSNWTDCFGNDIEYVEEVLIGGDATVIKVF